MPESDHGHPPARALRPDLVLAATALMLAALPVASRAQAVYGSAGYDYYSGPLDQITRTIEAFGAARIGDGSVSATLSHFDDSLVGSGIGLGGGVALPIAPRTRFRVTGTDYEGDSSFHGWRLKAGPQWRLATGQSIAIYGAHYQDNVLGSSNSLSLNFGAQATDELSLRASLGVASGLGVEGAQGSVGLSWTAFQHLELSGDVGMAQSGLVSSGPFPSRHEPSPNQPAESTVELGIRYLFP